MARTKSNGTIASTATIGFEAKLWLAAEQAVPAPHIAEAEYNGARPEGLLGLIATIELACRPGAPTRSDGAESPGEGTGPTSHRSVDLLGRVYEYFLTRFASAEGKNGGPAKCEVRSANVEVKTSRPFGIRNSSFDIPPDPACGSGGMAKCEVRSASVEVKTSRPFVIRNSAFDISPADIGKEHADTFRSVQHPDLRADWQMANAEVRMWN